MHPDEEDEDYDDEDLDHSLTKRQKTNNDYTESMNINH